MPNHITNRLRVMGESKRISKFFNEISCPESSARICFNKIIPMPKILEYNPHNGIETAIKKKYNIALNDNPLIRFLEIENRRKQALEFEGQDKILFEQGCKAYEQTGFISWYDWRIENWGTKWDAYDTPDNRDTEDTIFFSTAWNAPIKIIFKLIDLATKLDLYLEYDYADEDIGHNAGRVIIRHQEAWTCKIKDGSKYAYDLAFNLNPESKKYYKLINDKYIYIDK
jgi:hypothetical protein